MRRPAILLRCLFLALHVAGCTAQTQIALTPAVEPLETSAAWLPGRIQYSGNTDYVPRSLLARPAGELELRYSVEASTGRDDANEALLTINPFLLFGYPMGVSLATARAHLEIVRGTRRVREYDAVAELRRRRTLYSGDSLTDLRRDALLAVRDNLDHQLSHDYQVLADLLQARGEP